MIEELTKLEKINIPIISIIIYCIPFVLGSIIAGGNVFSDKELAILIPQLPYLIAGLLSLSYVELNIGAIKLLYFLAIVYSIRILSSSLSYIFKICNDKNSNCNSGEDLDPKKTFTFTYKGMDGITDETSTMHGSVDNLLNDGLLLPAFAFVLVFMNTQNLIIKTLCIIFMIIVYILIFYGNKNISFKYINCNEKEKVCYSFFSESFIYAISLISAYFIMN